MAGLDPAIHAFVLCKKALLFLKKKKQKDFLYWAPGADAWLPQRGG
jgi:hypothetical protein